MKKVIKSVLLIVVLATTLIVKGNNVNISINEKSKIINFKIDNNDGDLKVVVKDERGLILHTEKYVGSAFAKSYDFKSLPNGNYYIEVEGKTKVKIFPISITNLGVKLIKKNELVFYKPVIRKSENRVFISKLNLLNNESLLVKLYDEKGNLLFNEKLTKELNLAITLNLENLKSGNYRLVLESNDKTYTESILK